MSRKPTADTQLKVMTVLGTRPELIKLSRVIFELDRSVDHILVHTGQNFTHGLNQVFFEQLDIRRPDYHLEARAETTMETISQILTRVDAILEREAPDALLVLGDTNSCLAALAAKQRRIPIFHMEAGNRSFDQRIPEEVNRKLVDHVSDINLPYTEHARRYLLAEGMDPARVIKTGSPLREVLDHYRPGIDRSSILDDLELEPGAFFVVSAHRQENVDDPERLGRLLRSLREVTDAFSTPMVVSTHPRTRERLASLSRSNEEEPAGIRFLDPLGFLDYIRLQEESFCVLSDSGSLTEEASILGFPAVAIRDAQERPEGMDEGTVILAGLGPERILQAVRVATEHRDLAGGPYSRTSSEYEATDVSRKVVRILISYVDYVREVVYRSRADSTST